VTPEKIDTYRAVCRLERQGATDGERESARKARERMELRYPGIAEAAGAAADAEQGPARGPRAPAGGGIDWGAVWSFAKANFGSVQAWLETLAADAEEQAAVRELLDEVSIEVKANKKTVVWRFTMDVEDFSELAELCGPEMDGDTWKDAAKQFGSIAEEAFLDTFAKPDSEK
jgi:hypothetical protein